MFNRCHRCEKSLSALARKCSNCGADLPDSWLHKVIRWAGMIWRGFLRITLLYCVVMGLNIEPAVPAAVAMICAYFLLSYKAAQIGRIVLDQFSTTEVRLIKLEAAATQSPTTHQNNPR